MSNEIQDDQSSDSLLLWLTQHIDVIDACPPAKRDTLLRGLLDIYLLQRMPGACSPFCLFFFFWFVSFNEFCF